MITATTEAAIRALIFLACREEDLPASPREIADSIGGSQSYMAKIAGMLTRAGLVRSRSGVLGGITLARPAAQITLLHIVQACQGLVIADYCNALGGKTSPDVCGFHQAMHDLHSATLRSLSRWSLKQLAAQPTPQGPLAGNSQCRMASLASCCEGCSASEQPHTTPPIAARTSRTHRFRKS
jgi:Rrf2 family protein